jgi:mannose-6-phosphate isomerase-like protein (cupin superfamily)
VDRNEMTISSEAADFLTAVDRSGFHMDSFLETCEKPWGRERLLTPPGLPYVVKIIEINAGAYLSLQTHSNKVESWTPMTGQVGLVWEDLYGELNELELNQGHGYTLQHGQIHRLFGITGCTVLEASTPELGTTFRLHDMYARPDETEELRSQPGRGYSPPA